MTSFTITTDMTRNCTFEDAVKAVPEDATNLYIYPMVYEGLTFADIQAGLRAISSTITHINIDGLFGDSNGLLRFDSAQEIYAAFPSTLTSLSMSIELPLDLNERIAIFSLIPPHISEIRFGARYVANAVNIQSTCDLLKRLPRTIERLSFSNSELGKKSPQSLQLLFQSLPESLLELDLQNCMLRRLDANDLSEAFSGLPNHLMKLELTANEFNSRSSSEMYLITQALPLSILSSQNTAASSTFNLALIKILKHFIDEVKAGRSSYDKLMSEIQAQEIRLLQRGLTEGNKNVIRRRLQLFELKKQLLSYINGPVNVSYNVLADWFQSESCAIANKKLLAIWSLYLSLSSHFLRDTNPMGIVALAELDFDDPIRFCAFLLWGKSKTSIETSGLLNHFFAYHLPFLSSENTALHDVYRFLNQLIHVSTVQELLDYANTTYSGARGAKVNYSIKSEEGAYIWQSSNLSGGDFEHHRELEVDGEQIPQLPSPQLPEDADAIVHLYRWFGPEMLKYLDSNFNEHMESFTLIVRGDEWEALIEILPDFILRGEISLIAGVVWIAKIIRERVIGKIDIDEWIDANPFYIYAICEGTDVLDELSAKQRDKSISALQKMISESDVNSQSILLWIYLYSEFGNLFGSEQKNEMNEFILGQTLRFSSELPDEVYSAIQEKIEVPTNFMLNKLRSFRHELITSFDVNSFESFKYKWGELRAKVYNLLHLCPELRNYNFYPIDVYKLKALYIEEMWRQSAEKFDLERVLIQMASFDDEKEVIYKRVILEALLFTHKPLLQDIFIQHLERHQIDWVNEKFSDDRFLLEKVIYFKNKHLVSKIFAAGYLASSEEVTKAAAFLVSEGCFEVLHQLMNLSGPNKLTSLAILKLYESAEEKSSPFLILFRDFLKTMPEDAFGIAYHYSPSTLKFFDVDMARTLFMTKKIPVAAFQYLAASAKQDVMIISIVYCEAPELLRRELGNKWINLFSSIDNMRRYGEYLLEKDAEKGNVCIQCAAALKFQAIQMAALKDNTDDLSVCMQDFVDILRVNREKMSAYRMNVNTLITNIIIAVISLPILCLPIMIKLIHSYHNENRFLFFGQRSKTTSEEKIEIIQADLAEIEDECRSGNEL